MKKAIGTASVISILAAPAAAQPSEQSGTKPSAQPKIIGSPLRWIDNRDYPPEALREGRTGRARYKLTIDVTGRVSDCEITQSSGHEDLDAQTCRILSRRARFVKAAGTDEVRYFESAFSWGL